MLNDFYFSKLSGTEQYSYNQLRSALYNRAGQCILRGITPESAYRIWKAVVLDNTDIVDYSGLIEQSSYDGRDVKFRFDYMDIDIEKYNRLLDSLLTRINDKLSASASDYVVCKTIYDTLASTISYRYELLNRYLALRRENSRELVEFLKKNDKAFTPYGVVTEKEGVCHGIAKLFKTLCNRFGLECACVGASRDSNAVNFEVGHMFNVVEIEGKRAFVDVTGGICDKQMRVVRYDLFLASQKTVEQEYRLSDEVEGCDSEELNYYSKNNLIFKDTRSLRRYLTSYRCSGEYSPINFRYVGSDMTDKQLQDYCLEILQAHCEDGKQAVFSDVRHGVCNGVIKCKTEE